jgi:hypothetical protein
MLEMKWQCDICHAGNVCDVSREADFGGVILMAQRDHENISPSCGLDGANIHVWVFQTNPQTLS